MYVQFLLYICRQKRGDMKQLSHYGCHVLGIFYGLKGAQLQVWEHILFWNQKYGPYPFSMKQLAADSGCGDASTANRAVNAILELEYILCQSEEGLFVPPDMVCQITRAGEMIELTETSDEELLRNAEESLQIAEGSLQNADGSLQNAEGSLQIATNLRERSKENIEEIYKEERRERRSNLFI